MHAWNRLEEMAESLSRTLPFVWDFLFLNELPRVAQASSGPWEVCRWHLEGAEGNYLAWCDFEGDQWCIEFLSTDWELASPQALWACRLWAYVDLIGDVHIQSRVPSSLRDRWVGVDLLNYFDQDLFAQRQFFTGAFT